MTRRGTQLSTKALPYAENNSDLERYRLSISLGLAATAVAMNVLAAVLSLMALSVS